VTTASTTAAEGIAERETSTRKDETWLLHHRADRRQVAIVGLYVSVLVAMVFVPAGANQTFPGQVLCGSLIGAVLGRLLATLATGRERHTDKTEVLMLGYFGAAAALATFIKSFATAGFILPLGVATVTFITLAILSFERTTILRANPRA